MHNLILPWEMYTQFGDPAYISHHADMSASRVVFGFITAVSRNAYPSVVGWAF